MVGQSIQQGTSEAFRPEGFSPFIEGQVAGDLVLSRFSSGLFRAMFAMKEIKNGNKIHGRVSA